jgi:chromosome segregation ATPase
MRIEKLKAQTTTQLAELGKKTDAINQLKKELAENKVTNLALEARIKPLRDQLLATEEELQTKSNALLEADRQLADNQAELAKMWAELGKRSLVAS